MAVVYNPNQEDDENQNGQQGQTQQVTNPGVVGTGGQTAGSAAPSQASPKGTSSGRFANLSGYIKANQGFNQTGGGLAGKINQNISSQGDQVTKNVASAVQNFNQQAQGQVQQAQQGQQLGQQIAADPVSATQNQAAVSTVRNVLDNNYSGPSTLNDLQGQQSAAALQAQAKNLASTAQQGQTEQGRFNLLRTMFNKPTYTTGQQNLDNLLIQGNKDQLKKIQDSRKLAGQVNQNLNSAVNQTAQVGSKAAEDYTTARQGLIEKLNSGVTNVASDLTARAEQAKAQQAKDIEAVIKRLQSGQITADDFNRLGGEATGLAAGNYTYNIDPASFISAAQDPTAKTIAGESDIAKLNALRNLLTGGKSSVANSEVSKLLTDFSDAAPGTYNNSLSFNTGAYQQAVGQKKADYDNKVRSATDVYGQQRNAGMQSLGEVTNDYNAMGGESAYIAALLKNKLSGVPMPVNLVEKREAMMNLQNFIKSVDDNYNSQLQALQSLLGGKLQINSDELIAPEDPGVR